MSNQTSPRTVILPESDRGTITAGLLVRRKVRALLWELGIKYTEDKGRLDSIFYLEHVTEEQRKILNSIKQSK